MQVVWTKWNWTRFWSRARLLLRCFLFVPGHVSSLGGCHYGLLNRYLCYSVVDTADLGKNSVLTRLEMRVDPDDLAFVPPLLHETLSTISSPVFSEFTLKLQSLPKDHRFFYPLNISGAWGDNWWMIDRDLDDMVKATGRNIKFVVHVAANSGIWSVGLQRFVGYMFPSMNARGLVRVVSPSSNPCQEEGGRLVW